MHPSKTVFHLSVIPMVHLLSARYYKVTLELEVIELEVILELQVELGNISPLQTSSMLKQSTNGSCTGFVSNV